MERFRASEMNYYEELGIGRNASNDEVRQAYKTLARLIHPDGQGDEKLRAMAELQMKRLNEILAILIDPENRRAYDDTLELGVARFQDQSTAPLPLALPLRRKPGRQGALRDEWLPLVVRHWFWVMIGALALVTVTVWYAVPQRARVGAAVVNSARTEPADHSPTPASKPEHQGHRSANAVARQTQVSAEAFSSRPPERPPQGQFARMPAAPTPEPVIAPDPAIPGMVTEAPKMQAQEGGSPFAGEWLYTPQVQEQKEPGGYRALYVEFVLDEQDGELVGTYRARYKVTNEAVSPVVLLYVRGKIQSGNQTNANWTSSTGAEGMLDLTLQGPGLLKVAWWTTKFGNQPALTSGNSLLIRQSP